MEKISIIGAGSWGCALAKVLLSNGHKVSMFSPIEEEVYILNKKKEQVDKLPGVILEGDFIATSNLKEAVEDSKIIITAVPSKFTRSIARDLALIVKDNQIIIDVAKGIEEKSLLTLSEQIKEEIPFANISVLSGPSHAEEVGKEMTTLVVCASHDMDTAKYIQKIFMNDYFRVYTSGDVKGVEIGGALKNVIALAAGIATGVGLGDNAKAALITRGIKEIEKIGTSVGGKKETFYGLTGVGDLIVTCDSVHSRNRKAGILIGKGYTLDEATNEVKMIVEGVYSAKAAKGLADKYNIEVPIITEVNNILFNNKNPRESLLDLMRRDSKEEI